MIELIGEVNVYFILMGSRVDLKFMVRSFKRYQKEKTAKIMIHGQMKTTMHTDMTHFTV
jgi:hypothetical protein